MIFRNTQDGQEIILRGNKCIDGQGQGLVSNLVPDNKVPNKVSLTVNGVQKYPEKVVYGKTSLKLMEANIMTNFVKKGHPTPATNGTIEDLYIIVQPSSPSADNIAITGDVLNAFVEKCGTWLTDFLNSSPNVNFGKISPDNNIILNQISLINEFTQSYMTCCFMPLFDIYLAGQVACVGVTLYWNTNTNKWVSFAKISNNTPVKNINGPLYSLYPTQIPIMLTFAQIVELISYTARTPYPEMVLTTAISDSTFFCNGAYWAKQEITSGSVDNDVVIYEPKNGCRFGRVGDIKHPAEYISVNTVNSTVLWKNQRELCNEMYSAVGSGNFMAAHVGMAVVAEAGTPNLKMIFRTCV